MQWHELLLLIAATFPLLILIDYRSKRETDKNPDIEFDLNSRMTISGLTFIPFSLLFYTENFWMNFLYFLPLYTYFYVWMMVANKKAWCPYSFSDLKVFGVSGFIGTVIAYYLFFHEGVLDSSAPVESANELGVNEQSANDPAIRERDYAEWPYYTALALVVMTLLIVGLERAFRKEPNVSSLMLLVLAVALPVLPLFIEHYWWGLLVAVILTGVCVPLVLKVLDDTEQGAIMFVVGYFFMMACFASILLYAFLF